MGYHILHRKWPSLPAMFLVMVPELLGTIVLLVLFGLAQPDLYRTQLWRAGDELGFNSSPNIVLYAYANYKPLPTTPFVWTRTLTDFNVAISVISLFVLLTKLIAAIMHVWYPLFALLFNVSLTVLYTVSVYGQAGPDYADPDRPSPSAWYIAKPCSVAANQKVQSSCNMAKGTFAATVIMLAVYLFNLGLTLWAMWPNPKNDINEDSDDEEFSGKRADQSWEMQGIPPTPKTGTMPFTPRTMAFNTLERRTTPHDRFR